MELISSGLGYGVDHAATISAVLHIEGLCHDADLREFVQSQKEPRCACRRIAEERIIRIHTIDANVRPTGAHAINRDLPGLATRKQRWSTAGCWSNSRLQDSRFEQIAAVEGKFAETLLGSEAPDGRGSTVDFVDVSAYRDLLRLTAHI